MSKRRQRNARCTAGCSEAGVTLVFMTILISVLVLFCGASISVGYSLLAAIQAQSVADSMALAASQALCSTNQCWQNARVAAAEVLSHSTILNSIGHGSELPNLNTGDFKTTDEINWTPVASNLDVTIERGQWLPNEPAETRFVSFEAYNQSNSRFDFAVTGLSPFVVSNAVRVRVVRQELAPIFSMLADALHVQPKGEALAVTGGTSLQPLPTAPIAIPLCNLLDWQGQYDPMPSASEYPFKGDPELRYSRAATDLLVTHAKWNCPFDDDSRCQNMVSYGLMPAFVSQPISEGGSFVYEEWECGGRDPDLYPMCAYVADNVLHFDTHWHLKSSMNFAVFLGNNETEIQNRLASTSNSDGFLYSSLGAAVTDSTNHPVGILESGLTTPASESAFLARIRNIGSIYGALPFSGNEAGAFQFYTPIKDSGITPEREGVTGLFEVNGSGAGQLSEVPFWTNPPVSPSTVRTSEILDPAHPEGFAAVRGVCPSEIVPDLANADYRNLKTWRVLVPVIYDHQSHCMNLNDVRGDNDNDVQPDSTHTWTTVGFIHVTFYDAVFGRSLAGSYSNGDYPDGGAAPYTYGKYRSPLWHAGDPKSDCNFARGRISSDSSFIAWMDTPKSESQRVSTLVSLNG